MIPRTVEDLTPAWLSDALEEDVTAVSSAPMGVGVGLVGQLYRLDVTTAKGPWSVIAKLAAAGEESRFVATILNMYGREVGFYQDLSHRTEISKPRCYFCDHDPETQDTVLLLEDVSPRGRMLDQVAGCSFEEAEPAIRALARHHATFWDDSTLGEIPWLWKLSDDPYPGAVQMAYDGAWPRVQELFPDAVTPAVRKLGDNYSERIPALFAKLCTGPLVLAHADWRLDNLFLAPDGDVVAVDWQLIDRSVGPRDLAYFVTQSMNIEGLADCERAFNSYLEALATNGVVADRDWAWEMFRYGAQFGFVYPVVAAGGLTVDDPRHLELTRAMLERSVAAIEALDAFELAL